MFIELIEEIKKQVSKARSEMEAKEIIERIKAKYAKKYKLKKLPSNSLLLKYVWDENVKKLLRRKTVRTISGVAVVALMAKPHECPGKCIYCPRGENAPQSYTGLEPATLRAKRLNYDAYEQVFDRLSTLEAIGHSVEKVEIIIMGGTFLATPIDYQRKFVAKIYKALNDYGNRIYDNTDIPLEDAIRENETAKVRCVGLTIETRPDFSKEKHVDIMLDYGTTRVELGVQTLDDNVYKMVRRGHTIKDVIEATRILKDSGLKVCYHMMPGLFKDIDEDLEMFKELFENPDFRPDMLKIYPTLVLEGTELYELWKRGKFKTYNDEEALELITKIKKILPRYVRVMRIQRDIPSQLIVAGPKKSNLGELVMKRMKELGIRCNCIRCREIGHLIYKENYELDFKKLHINVIEYEASKGTEFFLEVTDGYALIAYLRLRFPSEFAHRKEIDSKTAIVRELKVVGESIPIGKYKEDAFQHKGFGKILMKKAEEIARENGYKKIVVTSAIGTREYYKKLGYKRIGFYMGKILE